jgi:hypothetical protein
MKRTSTLLAILLMTCLSSIAQVDVELQINHMLGSQTFQMNQTAQNDLSQDFQVTRLEYYVSRITVIHDGGQTLPAGDAVVALVNANDGSSTTIELGSLNVTAIEGVKFHIGVYAPLNNEDPTLFASGHPLAPQSPSMHWGWAAGYRFLAMEGQAGSSFSQNFQLHGLGNGNYHENTVTVAGQSVGGTEIIYVAADYTRAIEAIDVASGPISHGEVGQAKTAVENFRDHVFSAGEELVGTNELADDFEWAVYPNPLTDGVATNVVISENVTDMVITITNSIGQVITSEELNGLTTYPLSLQEAGIYFVTLTRNGEVIATKTLTKK